MADTKNTEVLPASEPPASVPTAAPVKVVSEKRSGATPLIAALVVVMALVVGGVGGFALARATGPGGDRQIQQGQFAGGPGGGQQGQQGGPQQGPGGQHGPGGQQGQPPRPDGDDADDSTDDSTDDRSGDTGDDTEN